MLSDRCLSVLSVWLSRSSVTLVCCGQTVGWIKIKLGMQEAMAILCETGTHLRLLERAEPLQFSAHMSWPNGWTDQDATW